MRDTVNTVLGPKKVSELGKTLIHEHLLIGWPGWDGDSAFPFDRKEAAKICCDVLEKLKGLGYDLGQNALNDAFSRFKALADKKKDVFDEDIVALVDDSLAGAAQPIQVRRLRVVAGTEGPQTADSPSRPDRGGKGPVGQPRMGRGGTSRDGRGGGDQ